LKQGRYHLHYLDTTLPVVFTQLEEVFDSSRINTPLAHMYLDTIQRTLDKALSNGRCFGALVIEPVCHGAAGMVLIDPLFQRLLVRVCHNYKIPVIYDEIFVGVYRLGPFSSLHLLHEVPDIACYGKSLTGGAVPMAVTLATERVFASFLGASKQDALLHGHSYTAHPVGCATALTALDIYETASSPDTLLHIFPQKVRFNV
jgi:dethiobiotin synthetase/adenosylmethionine--8-amino-7-oxononanoate aminotransferase